MRIDENTHKSGGTRGENAARRAFKGVRLGAIAAVTLLVSTSLACAPKRTPHGPGVDVTQTTAAEIAPSPTNAPLSTPVWSDEDQATDPPRGLVVVGSDVVAACTSLQALHPRADDTRAWLDSMKSLARCMSSGELRGRHVVLHGPPRPQAVTRYVVTHLGVEASRIETTQDEMPTCDSAGCDWTELRVDIELADRPVRGASLSL